jgi:hypothetical protein
LVRGNGWINAKGGVRSFVAYIFTKPFGYCALRIFHLTKAGECALVLVTFGKP